MFTAKTYAQVVGVVLLLLGVVGLVLGDPPPLLGLLNIDIVEDIVHLLTGALLAYVGFGSRDAALNRTIVLGLGVVYLLVGILGFITPTLFGLLSHNYTIADDLFHLLLGVAAIAATMMQSGTTVEVRR